MKMRSRQYFLIMCVVLGSFGLIVVPQARAQEQATPQESKPKSADVKTETFENLTEHFEGDTEERGFPMSLFPQGTQGGLVLAAVGAGALGGLLAVGGGSIAMVNYESQTSPQTKPDERLAARTAGRVGLGVFGLGALLLFAPPVMLDWALPESADAPSRAILNQENVLPEDPTQATPIKSTTKGQELNELKKNPSKKEKKGPSTPVKKKSKPPKEPQKKAKKA